VTAVGSSIVREPSSAKRDSARTTDDAAARREIPVTEESASILEEGGRAKELHEQLESEERDVNWSDAMEAELRAYLAGKPELGTFLVAGVECRTSGCEIQLIGYGDSVQRTWVNATSDLYTQPWFDFSDMSTSVKSIKPATDVVAILVILVRSPR